MNVEIDHEVLKALLTRWPAGSDDMQVSGAITEARRVSGMVDTSLQHAGVYMRLPKKPPFEVPESFVVFAARWRGWPKETAAETMRASMRDHADYRLTNDPSCLERASALANQVCRTSPTAPLPELYVVNPEGLPSGIAAELQEKVAELEKEVKEATDLLEWHKSYTFLDGGEHHPRPIASIIEERDEARKATASSFATGVVWELVVASLPDVPPEPDPISDPTAWTEWSRAVVDRIKAIVDENAGIEDRISSAIKANEEELVAASAEIAKERQDLIDNNHHLILSFSELLSLTDPPTKPAKQAWDDIYDAVSRLTEKEAKPSNEGPPYTKRTKRSA